jgi:hypothetical protein
VAEVLLRRDDERHWLRAAPRLVGHLFPRLLAQSQYNTRLRQIAPLMEAAPRPAPPSSRTRVCPDGAPGSSSPATAWD